MISEKPWKHSLDETFSSLAAIAIDTQPRVSILGIGHELRGDDAAGVAVARLLTPLAHAALQVVHGAHAPENQLGLICDFVPHLVLLVDAIDTGCTPGAIAWIDWRDTSGVSASTHTLPLYMIAKYLQAMTDCRVTLLGIQPKAMEMDTGMSDEVTAAVSEVRQQLASRLGRLKNQQ